MIQVIALVGSLLVLGAYIASQRGALRAEQRTYIALNFLGAGILAAVAIVERQWGFLLLEGTWALVSVYSLVRPPKPA